MAQNGSGFEIGAGLKLSNPAIAVGGLVVLGVVSAHLISNILNGPKKRALNVEAKTSPATMHEAMFGEIQAMATDPSMVDRNADRVNEAIKQRRDYMKSLKEKLNRGEIGYQQLSDALQQHASDVMEQLEIPQNPHQASVHPDSLNLFKEHRRHHLTSKFAVPGGLMLDPEERAFIEHQKMAYSYQGTEQDRQATKDIIKDQIIAQRLAELRARQRERQEANLRRFIQSDEEHDRDVMSKIERRRAGL